MRAAQQDPRFAATINLDGGVNTGQGPRRQPALALTHEVRDRADADFVARVSKLFDGGRATSDRLGVPGSAHLSFTGAPLFLPPIPALVGSLGPAESVRMTVETSPAFSPSPRRAAGRRPGRDAGGVRRTVGDRPAAGR
ncbi:hypothetical protein ACTOB_004001 [Actinoplanes oblitus]|uniref:Uncharacterized protein n=1 Tax=Actinoplanes oblitus TaxID=3040509 RepID=A0ABY8WUD9_9ACTN|nr:hypothetical protein [Actinoplanes oblitus]WIN00304.1 hypothetical protein ACTOB_004001 [Actinoplanes oblitus]